MAARPSGRLVFPLPGAAGLSGLRRVREHVCCLKRDSCPGYLPWCAASPVLQGGEDVNGEGLTWEPGVGSRRGTVAIACWQAAPARQHPASEKVCIVCDRAGVCSRDVWRLAWLSAAALAVENWGSIPQCLQQFSWSLAARPPRRFGYCQAVRLVSAQVRATALAAGT